jgi:16S rRNA (guanine527-N7)-methyltransferase
MSSSEIIFNYFDNLTLLQKKQFEVLQSIYQEWNQQINVISRKDMDSFYERHVLHSLAIAKVIQFKEDTRILDIGTGGGFPGIPLAILFPNCHFHLVDSIGKKIKVVEEVVKTIGLKNVTYEHNRAEKVAGTFDFIISRAVTAMPEFLKWTKNKFNKKSFNTLENGILYLKGGDLTEEMKEIKQKIRYFPIKSYFKEDFFETKQVVYLKSK